MKRGAAAAGLDELCFDFEEELNSIPRRPRVEKKEDDTLTSGEEEAKQRPAPWPKACALRPVLPKEEERSPSRPAVEFLEVRGEGRPRQTPKQAPSSSSAGPGTLVQRKTPPPPPPPPPAVVLRWAGRARDQSATAGGAVTSNA